MYRVTRILKIIYDKDLEDFKAQVGPKYFEKIMKNAADRGTLFHAASEYLENNFQTIGDDDPFFRGIKLNNELIYPQIITYYKWLKENIEEVIFTEREFYDKSLDLGGRPDIIARLKGQKKIAVFDKKFTAKLSLKNHLQLAAYAELYRKEFGEMPDRYILHFTKEGKFKIVKLKNQAMEFSMFMFAYNLNKYYNGNGCKKK